MKNFVIFFHEKEGTSALVRLMDNFDQLSVVHQVEGKGWEPFDRHNCGDMRQKDLARCFDMIFGGEALDMGQLNRVYMKTGVRPLEVFDKSCSVGFKMRFQPPAGLPSGLRKVTDRVAFLEKAANEMHYRNFCKTMCATLRRHDVLVFIAARQDVFRLALSKYHGDGSGKRGHIQFKLAAGEVDRGSIPKIEVDCERFERFVQEAEHEQAEKRALAAELSAHGIEVHPLRYEDFLDDKTLYFRRVFSLLGLEVPDAEIDAALGRGAVFEKVHSDDISEFVENHEAVSERFGHRYAAWK